MDSNEAKEKIDALKQDLRSTATQILDEAFNKEQVNLIAAPGDSSLCIHAAAAGKLVANIAWIFWLLTSSGYPIATVPIGQLRYNNRPFGLCLVAKENEEDILLRFMNAYEKVAKPRPVPNI